MKIQGLSSKLLYYLWIKLDEDPSIEIFLTQFLENDAGNSTLVLGAY
jgi:hypothetical protein